MPKTEGVDNFEMMLTRDVRGYFSCIDPTIIKDYFLIRGSQNVYKDSNDLISNRSGRKLFTGDSVDSTIAGVKAAYVWNSSLGAVHRLQIANSKLQVASDVVTSGTYVWYDLLTSLSNTRGVFEPWWNNTLKKDQLIIAIGDSSLRMWSGGIGKIISTTINTIVLNDTIASLGFNTASGSVLINGNTYTYTGSSGSTLTGVTADPTGEAVSSAVLQTVVVSATTPASGFNNDFIKVIGNRLHCGSYTSRLCYISSNTDYTNFTVPGTRTSGTPELLTLDGALNGIGVRQGKAHISGGTSDWYIVSYQEVTVGTTLTEVTTVEKQESSNQAAALAHEFIDTVNDTIVYLSKDKQLRAFGTFRNLNTPSYPVLSHEVADELAAVDFTLGQLKCVSQGANGNLIYITAPASGVTYIHQTNTSVDTQGNVTSERLWWPPWIIGFSRIDVVSGVTVGFSNSNPQTYSFWETGQWVDDIPEGTVPYISVALFPYRSYGRRQGKFKADKLYIEGYMSPATVLNGGIYYDYQGSSGLLSLVIHDPNNSPANSQSFFSGPVPPSLGDSSLGDNPLGSPVNYGLDEHSTLPKYRIINGVQLIDFFEAAVMIYSQDADSRWEIIAVGLNPVETTSQAVEIIKTSS